MMNWLKLTVLPPIGAAVIRFLGRTVRVRTEEADFVDRLYREGRNVILAFWHSRQLMMPLTYRGKEVHVLISQHRDGELIARIVARFGIQSVRGSTTRGGVQALRQLIRLGRSGVDLAVTPDGPRGPRQVVQIGVVQLAQATGLPIVPVTFSCSKKKSSRAGIGSSFPIPGAGDCSFGELPSGCLRTPPPRTWKPSALNWR
jgi:hypothetical protein